jgi:hypothetical protein
MSYCKSYFSGTPDEVNDLNVLKTVDSSLRSEWQDTHFWGFAAASKKSQPQPAPWPVKLLPEPG